MKKEAKYFSRRKIALPVVLFSYLMSGFFQFCTFNANAHEVKPGEYRVKAAFIYNFLKFIEWPAANNPSLKICVIGEDHFGNDIREMLSGTVNNRKLSVKNISDYGELKKCNLVFINHSEEDHLAELVNIAREYHIVTIGDTDGFAQQGVMINFYLQENKIRFEINNDAARRSGIRISSKLLNLAKIVGNDRKR
ncbi:MAG: YfiR family protein [Thermodesulfovibrionales bacterium]|nr:YfiR family protein [Thermodesulfovibrionales bacterium]